jgi:hypothetical protein
MFGKTIAGTRQPATPGSIACPASAGHKRQQQQAEREK